MPDTLSRLADEQLPAVLDLLAAAGATPRTPESWRHDAMTALLLGPQSAPVAALPLARRTLAIAPGRTLQVGWISSNMFSSRMGLRRQTRSTAGQWPDLLPELDALVVVRRDEPSLAARWYAQTGFAPVLAIRCLYLDMESPPPAPAGRYRTQVLPAAEAAAWQPQMLAVHRDVFGHYGGPVRRHDAFWAPALEHHYYRPHYQFQVLGLWNAETLMGYAVVGWSGWHSKRPRMDILELATRQWDTAVAQELLLTTCQLAWSKNVSQVRAVISVHDPYRSHLTRTGFADRWGYLLLAKWLHPQRYLDRLAAHPAVAEALGDLSVQIDTPGAVSLTLPPSPTSPSPAAGRLLRLQADAPTVTRLLLQRLEISAALHDGSVVVRDGRESDPARLALALPWTPWVFHMLDYI